MSQADPNPRADLEPPLVAELITAQVTADAAGGTDVAGDVPVASRAAAFCNRCGRRFSLDQPGCATCGADDAASAAELAPAIDVTDGEIASVRSAVRLYFSLLAVSAVTLFAAAGWSKGEPLPVELQFVASGCISVVALLWAIRWRATLLPVLRRSGSPLWYGVAPVLGVCTFVVASLVVSALQKGAGIHDLHYLDEFNEGGYTFAAAILWICVQPAVFEELAFRGVIVSALGRVLSVGETTLVSALLFGILHLSIPSLAHLTLLGLLLAWLRRRSGSLYPCMLMHFTHNLLVLLNERNGWTPW